MNHTPGPWAVHPQRAVVVPQEHLTRPLGGHENAARDREEFAQEVCLLHWPDRHRREHEVLSNARLIAAAPELMEAVTLLMEAMRMQEERESGAFHIKQEVALCIWNDALEAARAAIKKARGE
jgi:hypothetical protein